MSDTESTQQQVRAERKACADIARAEFDRLMAMHTETEHLDTVATAFADGGQLARLRFNIAARASTAAEIGLAILRRK